MNLPAGSHQLAAAENTAEVEEGLRMILEEIGLRTSPYIRVETFEEALGTPRTSRDGLVLTMNNGLKVTISIHERGSF